MAWKRWRVGLLVAVVTGICTAFTVGMIVPAMTWREGALVLMGSIGKDLLLFLKEHPVGQISNGHCDCTVPPSR